MEDFADQQVEVLRAGAVVAQASAQNGAIVYGDGGEVGASGRLDAVGYAGVEAVRGAGGVDDAEQATGQGPPATSSSRGWAVILSRSWSARVR